MTERCKRGPAVTVAGLIPDGDLTLLPGTITLIAGPNGAGKTHLLEQLAGLRPPGRLTIRWGDRPLWTGSGANDCGRLRREALLMYGYAGQDAEALLFARTVEEELRVSLRPFRLPEAERRRRIGAAPALFGWPPSVLSRDPFRMSGGERRRVALLTALVTPAPWLLLDEPTVGLDAEGQRRLADALRQCKAEGRGIVLVSHDWDWALPLADRLLLVRGPGRPPVWCERADLLARPAVWAEAGVEPPVWWPLARAAWRRGVPEADVWEPQALARHAGTWQALRAGAFRFAGYASAGRDDAESAGPARRDEAADGISGADTETAANARASSTVVRETAVRAEKGGSRLAAFDARALLLAYGLLALGLMHMREWSDLLAGGVAVSAVIALGRMPLWRWRGLIGGWLMMSLFVSAFAGWAGREPGGWFAFAPFDRTLRAFLGTLLAMLPGAGLLLAISPLKLGLALERLLRFRGRVPAAVRKLALTVTMMLRFVPMLLREWERFARLTLARGKSARASPATWLRRLREQTLPFLLAAFRLAEETATALESRGAGRMPPDGARIPVSRWTTADTALTVGAALLAACLAWWCSIS